MKNIENIDDLLLDSESFHVKDRSKAARRKKAYFKGKKRFDRAYNKGLLHFLRQSRLFVECSVRQTL